MSRCKKAINTDPRLTDKEDDSKKISVTLFDQTLVNVLDMNKR